ncbi:putative G-protein coupled receptor 45 [Silurus meridionalis]|nr:putative G-protein coupled receptor 45 [Silurus meridionalis]
MMVCNISSGCGLPEHHMLNYVTNVTGLQETSNLPLPVSLKIVLSVIMVVIIATGFLGNAIVCLVVYQKPAMRSAINLLLATLAFSDIMLSLFCMPVTAVTVVSDDWCFGLDFCRITLVLYWLFVLEGVSILLIISVDRFLIIVQRQDKLTPSRARLLITASWFFSFCLALPAAGSVPTLKASRCVLGYIESPNRGYTLLMVNAAFFVPVSVMLVSYLRILNTVRRNALRVHNHTFPSPEHGGKVSLPVLRRPPQLNVDMSFKTRAFSTILILFVGFSVCWLPHTVLGLLVAFNQKFYTSGEFYAASVGALWLSYVKAVFNPVVYCWRIRKFREACDEFVPRSFRMPRLRARGGPRVRPCSIYVCAESQSAM